MLGTNDVRNRHGKPEEEVGALLPRRLGRSIELIGTAGVCSDRRR